VRQICETIVGLVVKAPKLAQIMLRTYKLILAIVPSQIFRCSRNMGQNPRWPPPLVVKF